MVEAVRTISDVDLSIETIAQNLLLALLMMLLIVFPADVFNSTLLANYDEVRGWLQLDRLDGITSAMRRLPHVFELGFFGLAGALLASQMSGDVGFDRKSLALVIGLFGAIVLTSMIYDLARGWYMHRRFGEPSGLVIHPVGLMVGALMVVMSRLAHFEPGYVFGLFTALRFQRPPDPHAEGRGLAISSVLLGLAGVVGWLLLGPVRDSVGDGSSSFLMQALEAGLASFWIVSLGAIVFGLIPMRFLYGSSVKHWSNTGWRLIWGTGVFLFVATLLHPETGFYGASPNASLRSVLIPFIGFGVFSFAFWGYFRYRHIWRGTPDDEPSVIEREGPIE